MSEHSLLPRAPVAGPMSRPVHNPGTRSNSMYRIRLGLVGLSAIAAIVFAASAGISSHARENSQSASGETLSVLGVAPKMEKDAPDPAAEAADPGEPR